MASKLKFSALVLIISLISSYASGASKAEVAGASTPEMIYFVMTDRFANGDASNDEGGQPGSRQSNGFDPSDVGFYHGGDIRGLSDKLEYIKSMGFTAVWITPVVRQLTVAPNGASTAYHGYWGVGFDQIDPHLGTMKEFKDFVAKAHSMDLKIILDVVVNHTADVIRYNEDYSYINLEDKPYKTITGKKIDVIKLAGSKSFPTLGQLSLKTSFPKTPFIPSFLKNSKSPAWLNDPRNYHNRGNSTFQGESSLFGDFYGLDDLMTESPIVVDGFTKIISTWVTQTGIDGLRIDTARHVNEAFWKSFLPAIRKSASSVGKSDFPMWGEVFDANPLATSYWVKNASFTEVLDFPLQDSVVNFVSRKSAFPLANVFNEDDRYLTATTSAYGLGTFLGNHDMGRVATKVSVGVTPQVALLRDQMAHALLFTLRGVPAVYYGDEFGLMGGGDKEARQDLFPTQIDRWKIQERVGGSPIGEASSFDTTNPLQETLRTLTQLRKDYPAFVNGAQKINMATNGIFSFSRFDPQTNREYLCIYNSNSEATTFVIPTSTPHTTWKTILGLANELNQPALSWSVLEAQDLPEIAMPLQVTLLKPTLDTVDQSQVQLQAKTNSVAPVHVEFFTRSGGSTWRSLGVDISPTFSSYEAGVGLYRDFPNRASFLKGKVAEFKAVAKNSDGTTTESSTLTLRL